MGEYIAIPKSLFHRDRKNWKTRLFVFSVLAAMADKDGMVDVSRRNFCKENGISEQEFRSALDSLIKDGYFIKQPTTNPPTNPQVTHLSICNTFGYNIVSPTTNPPTNPQVTHLPQNSPILPSPPANSASAHKEKENEKENLSPTPPIKEKEKEKESFAPNSGYKEKEGKTNLRLFQGEKEFSSNAVAFSDKQKEKGILEVRKKNMMKRMSDFYISLIPFVSTYGREMIREFFNYWSEPNKSQTQMRFELEKTWFLSLRLAYWEKRQNQINRKYETQSDRKARANAKVALWLRDEVVRTLYGMDEEEQPLI